MKAITTPACLVCEQASTLEVTLPDAILISRWQRGEGHIQDLLPHWTPEQREMLQTGMHPACWEAVFGTDDEEEDGA